MLIKVGVLHNEHLASFQQENSSSFESAVEVQCMELVAAIEARKAQLLDFVRQEREMRLRALREQMTLCTARLQQTTALLQFCIEALKETDSVSFLQVSALFFFCGAECIGKFTARI
jgi:tripartite motif-containing protein 9/67